MYGGKYADALDSWLHHSFDLGPMFYDAKIFMTLPWIFLVMVEDKLEGICD